MSSRRLVGILVSVSIIFSACGTSTPSPAPPSSGGGPAGSSTGSSPGSSTSGSSGHITVLLVATIDSLDQNLDNSLNTTTIQLNLFDRLIQLGTHMELQPGLATSWENTDPTTWRFHLRQGVKFHDGEPFNANAVKYTFERAARKGSQNAFFVGSVKTVNVVDDNTVDIITNHPDPSLASVAGTWVDIVPPVAGEKADFAQNPIGTGPYEFVSQTVGDRVETKANPDYWGGPPAIGAVTFQMVPDPATRLAELLGGQADLIPPIQAQQKQPIDSSGVAKTVSIDGVRKMMILMDPTVKPLGDPLVRQALNFAVDKDALIQTVMGGDAVKSMGAVSVGVPGYNSNLTNYYDYNPEKAKSLLAQAGYPNGFDVKFSCSSGSFPKDIEVCQAITEMLGKVGVRATLSTEEYATYRTDLFAGKLGGLGLYVFAFFTADPWLLYAVVLWSKGGVPYVRDPAIDKAFEATLSEFDSAKRYAAYQSLEETTVKNVAPWIFLWDLKNVYGVSNRLNWSPTIFDPIDLRGTTLKP